MPSYVPPTQDEQALAVRRAALQRAAGTGSAYYDRARGMQAGGGYADAPGGFNNSDGRFTAQRYHPTQAGPTTTAATQAQTPSATPTPTPSGGVDFQSTVQQGGEQRAPADQPPSTTTPTDPWTLSDATASGEGQGQWTLGEPDSGGGGGGGGGGSTQTFTDVTRGVGGKDGMGHAVAGGDDPVGMAADAYRAQAGEGPRGNAGRLVNGHWTGGDPKYEGMSVDEFNNEIAKWDAGFRAATGQQFNHATNSWEMNPAWAASHGLDANGGPAGGGAGAGGGGTPGSSGDLESETNAFIRKLMSGEAGPYTDKMKAGQLDQSAKRRSADILNANQGATIAAARGGNANSPTTQALLQQNAATGREGAASDAQAIDFEANQENFKAKIQGLQAAQDSVQRKYQDAWNKATDATQRYGIQQQFAAAMAKIQAEKEAAQNMADAERIQGAAGRAFQEKMFGLQNERSDYEYQRDLPTNTYRNAAGALGGY